MKTIISCLIFCLCIFDTGEVLLAQQNNVLNFNPHFETIGSRYQPTRLGDGFRKVDISFPINSHFWFGGNAIGNRELRKILKTDTLQTSLIEEIVDKMDDVVNTRFGIDYQIFSLAFNIKRQDRTWLSVALSQVYRATGNLSFSKNLASLAVNGNADVAGQLIELGPLAANGMFYREYSLRLAKPIYVNDYILKAGLDLKYMIGMAVAYTERGDFSYFTSEDGQYIDINFDYAFNTAFSDEGESWAKGLGRGIGANLGFSVERDNMRGTVTIADLGKITFKDSVTNYRQSGTKTYEGIIVDFFDEVEDQFNLDSLVDLFEPEETYEEFSVHPGPTLMLQFEYHLGESFTKKERPYFKHNFYFNYLQGFKEEFSISKKPMFSLGYTRSFGNIFNLGTSVGLGPHGRFAFGPYMSVRGGAFKFGIGSNNILPLFARRGLTGGDLQVNMGLSF